MTILPSQLSLTLPLHPSETATSFASRLAARTGSGRLVNFCTDMGFNKIKLANGDQDTVRQLAVLAGADPHLLLSATPQFLPGNEYGVGATRIKFTEFHRKTVRVCPVCLKDDLEKHGEYGPHQRVHWQIHSIRCCLRHDRLLVAIENSGGSKNGDDFFYELRGRPDIAGGRCELIGPHSLQLYLMGRLQGVSGPKWLDSQPFHVVAQTSEAFGLLLIKGPDAKRIETTEEEWIQAGTTGFDILANGEEGLTSKLKELQLEGAMEHALYRSKYRVFYQWLRERRNDTDFAAITNIVRNFVLGNFPVKVGAKVLGETCVRQQLHTIGTASRKFGVPRKQLAAKLEEVGLVRRTLSSGWPTLVEYLDEDYVVELSENLKSLVDSRTATAYLNLEPSSFSKLSAKDIIQKYLKMTGNIPKYRMSDLDAFIARLKADTCSQHPASEFLCDIPSAASRTHCRSEHIIELILSGKLRSAVELSGKTGVRGIGVDLREVQNALSISGKIGMSKLAAVERLMICDRSIKALVADGELSEITVLRPVTGKTIRLVCSKSIARFERKFVSLGKLASTLDREAGPLFQHLAGIGITPVKAKDTLSRIYLKSDVSPA